MATPRKLRGRGAAGAGLGGSLRGGPDRRLLARRLVHRVLARGPKEAAVRHRWEVWLVVVVVVLLVLVLVLMVCWPRRQWWRWVKWGWRPTRSC